jgi:protein-S-isoprenylcysteine O-methyltransferase Ste14
VSGSGHIALPAWIAAILASGWIAWLLPFLLARKSRERPSTLDRRARWGIVLQGIGYFVVWQVPLWRTSPAAWRVGVSIFFFALAAFLSWSSARVLGRQWRLDAGLNADHELVQGGAYRLVRHPIYASMLCLLLGMGFLLVPLPLLLLATLLNVAGTEIRVQIEDALLASRFGERFRDYKSRVPAYAPFLR